MWFDCYKTISVYVNVFTLKFIDKYTKVTKMRLNVTNYN